MSQTKKTLSVFIVLVLIFYLGYLSFRKPPKTEPIKKSARSVEQKRTVASASPITVKNDLKTDEGSPVIDLYEIEEGRRIYQEMRRSKEQTFFFNVFQVGTNHKPFLVQNTTEPSKKIGDSFFEMVQFELPDNLTDFNKWILPYYWKVEYDDEAELMLITNDYLNQCKDITEFDSCEYIPGIEYFYWKDLIPNLTSKEDASPQRAGASFKCAWGYMRATITKSEYLDCLELYLSFDKVQFENMKEKN